MKKQYTSKIVLIIAVFAVLTIVLITGSKQDAKDYANAQVITCEVISKSNHFTGGRSSSNKKATVRTTCGELKIKKGSRYNSQHGRELLASLELNKTYNLTVMGSRKFIIKVEPVNH